MNIYVTYLTTYSGNKLPPFYIGSSSKDKILNGYRGTVLSKKYKSIWKEELKSNPHLFKTKIVSEHIDRKDALEKELILQKKMNVVKSPMYINMSLATVNGFFGMDLTGKTHSEETKRKISDIKKGKKRETFSEEWRRNISLSHKGKTPWNKGISPSEETRRKTSNSCKGINTGPKTPEHKSKMSFHKNNSTKISCPHCGKQGQLATMKGNHIPYCKSNPNRKEKPLLTCSVCGHTAIDSANFRRYHNNNCKLGPHCP